MKRAIMAAAALALGLVPVSASAHGPGRGMLWKNMPWEQVAHTHCKAGSVNANEFFITVAPSTSIGVGKTSQDVTRTDWYLIVPIVPGGPYVHNHPATYPGGAQLDPCGDGQGVP